MCVARLHLLMQEAIAAGQFFDRVRTIKEGDVDGSLAGAEHTAVGQLRIGGQDHFYMETQASIAVPKGENGEMEIFSSTQYVDSVQKSAAAALGVPANRIVARVKRAGE